MFRAARRQPTGTLTLSHTLSRLTLSLLATSILVLWASAANAAGKVVWEVDTHG